MPTILPRSPDFQHIRKRAKQLLHEHREGNRSVGDRIRHHHARFAGAALRAYTKIMLIGRQSEK